MVVGVYEYLKKAVPGSKILGFVGGSEGFYSKQYVELDDEVVSSYKHTGGFELLGRSKEQLASEIWPEILSSYLCLKRVSFCFTKSAFSCTSSVFQVFCQTRCDVTNSVIQFMTSDSELQVATNCF